MRITLTLFCSLALWSFNQFKNLSLETAQANATEIKIFKTLPDKNKGYLAANLVSDRRTAQSTVAPSYFEHLHAQNPVPENSAGLTSEFSPSTEDLFTEPDIEDQPLDPDDVDAELGEIEIIRRPPRRQSRRPQPTVQLLIRSSAFTSSNLTAREEFNPSDTLFYNSAELLATPKLGPETRLVAAASGGLVRLADRGDSNYNFFNFKGGLYQRLAPSTYGQLGWEQQQLYRDGDGERLLLDNSIRLVLGRRDQLANRLELNSSYNLRVKFAEPEERSWVSNALAVRLRYNITPELAGLLGYQLTLNDFTKVERFDTEHRLRAGVVYSFAPNIFIEGSGSYLFGASSEPSVDLSNFSLGVNLGLNLSLF